MRSLLLVTLSGGLALALWRLEVALAAARPSNVERPGAPHLYPIRRNRSDGPSKLFIDTPSFRRRLQAGWGADDRDRVPR